MSWLVRDGRVLATLEVQTSLHGRARGLLGRDGIDGAILLRPAHSVHTFRMRFAIDVAFCDRDLTVLKVVTLRPNRLTRPVLRCHSVLECEAGMLARWGIGPGTHLEVRGRTDGEDGDPEGTGAGHRSDGLRRLRRRGSGPAAPTASSRALSGT